LGFLEFQQSIQNERVKYSLVIMSRDGFSPLKLVLNWSFKPVLSVFSLKKLNRFKPVYKIIKNFFIDYPIKMYKQPDWLNVGSFFFNFSIENE